MRFCSAFLIFLILVAGCSSPYMGKDLFGADEFVLDSYRIREGKLSILEMEGKEVGELDEAMLDEYQDTIHEDDVLQVAIYNPKRSDVSAAVEYVGSKIGYRVVNGEITLPDLPPIAVSDLTLEQARAKIQDLYQEHIRDTEVFVTYKERIARKVELAGLVALSSVPVD